MKVFITCLLLLSSKAAFAGIALAVYCPFCNPNLIERQSVFESEHFQVLVDYEPRVRGHLLAIPKRHIPKAHLMSKEEWEDLSIVIPKIARVFSEFLGTDQYILLEKNGPNAFQVVPHVHFHLFPMHSETWKEVFDIVPMQLTSEDLEKEVKEFGGFFSKMP